MARDNDVTQLTQSSAAASAGTTTTYFPIAPTGGVLTTEGPQAAVFVGFSWNYNSAEPNTDNTIDFLIDYTATDGTTFVTLFSNGNPNGLLDTSAPLVQNKNKGNAAGSGQTGIDVAVTAVRIPAGSILRSATTTAGTGTVPATQLSSLVKYV